MKERKTDFLKTSLIAHRGYHDIKNGIPENTIPAFKRAIENNLIIELDVHILKDNNIVVFHDDNIKRMTNIDRNIKDFSYNELKKIKLKNSKECIPLLKDVLKLVNGKVPIVIETKYDVKHNRLEKELINILKTYKGLYVIQSFNPLSLIFFKKNYPSILRGQLISKRNSKGLRKKILIKLVSPDYLSCNVKILPNKRISKFRKEKMVLGWTIRSNEELNSAKKYCDNFVCEEFKLQKKS